MRPQEEEEEEEKEEEKEEEEGEQGQSIHPFIYPSRIDGPH
jgi:hypothetical protein